MWGKRILVSAFACVAASSAHATVLTFDTDINNPSVVFVFDHNYGDRVSAPLQGMASYGVGAEGFTPNVVVSYLNTSGFPVFIRDVEFYGDLTRVIWNSAPFGVVQLQFTADPGFDVVLHGFDLAGWPNADRTIPGVSVTSGSSTLFSQSNVLVNGAPPLPQHTGFEFAGGLRGGQSLTLNLDLTGLATYRHVGIDNVRFGQIALAPPPVGGVPEPATWAVMVLGFAGVGGLLRARARRLAPA